MSTTPNSAIALANSVSLHDHHEQKHFHQTGPHRLRHFLRPDGRKVHIASSPEEAERLGKTLSIIEKDRFDLVIHGSPEHVEALRDTHAHHEDKRAMLRLQYGDIWDEFEHVARELDSLSNELHMITDHAVQLAANFSKYGYSAHIRTRDSPNHSSATSIHGDQTPSRSSHDWEAERHNGNSIKFWQKPIVRQYFHKGLLWRAQEIHEVASYELFVDLLFVGIIGISGDNAAESANGEGLLQFAITFILGWKVWSDITLFVSWFEADDIVRRLCVLFNLVCLLGYTTNILDSFADTYSSLIGFYLAARLFAALSFTWMAYLIPMVRGTMILNSIMIILPSILWIGSIHVENPGRQALIWPAIALDLFGTWIIWYLQKGVLRQIPSKIAEYVAKLYEFYPATSIEHKIDRTGAFVTLVFGYSVLSLLYQSRAAMGINAFFGKAILALIQAFSFNWMYFEVDAFNLDTHAIRRHWLSALWWLAMHLPFIMGFVLASSSLSRLVLAHDCANADPATLVDVYAIKSPENISPAVRWFYCAGLGVALACMGVISLTHRYKTFEGQRLDRRYRIVLRFAVAIVLICLPLAGDTLNSLQLIATTTCLVVVVLGFDLVGETSMEERFWRCKRQGRPCTYVARCHISKKDLEASVKSGEVIKVEEIAKKQGGNTGVYDMS